MAPTNDIEGWLSGKQATAGLISGPYGVLETMLESPDSALQTFYLTPIPLGRPSSMSRWLGLRL